MKTAEGVELKHWPSERLAGFGQGSPVCWIADPPMSPQLGVVLVANDERERVTCTGCVSWLKGNPCTMPTSEVLCCTRCGWSLPVGVGLRNECPDCRAVPLTILTGTKEEISARLDDIHQNQHGRG